MATFLPEEHSCPCPNGVEAQSEGASGGLQEVEVDELIMVGESVCLGPFQMEIIEG